MPTSTTARSLLDELAAVAVRRDARTVPAALQTAAPWVAVLPPAALRQLSDQVATAVLATGGEQADAVGAVLERWRDVAARFAD